LYLIKTVKGDDELTVAMESVEEGPQRLDCNTPPVKASTSCGELVHRIVHTTDLENGSGDVTIVVKYHKKRKRLHGLLVSSQAMARASCVWKQMFTGAWAETQEDRPLVLDYTDDDSMAVVTIMKIIHLRFNDVPLTVTLSELQAIASFTDKFMVTGLVLPWIEGWLGPLSALVDKVGCEAEWLRISWEFGLIDVFDRIGRRIAFGAPVPVVEVPPPPSKSDPWGISRVPVSSSPSEEHGDQDIFYAVNFDDLPPGVEDVATRARLAMVHRMLKEVYDYFDALISWTTDPKASDSPPTAGSVCARSKQDCIRLQIGSLLPVLNSLGLWPKLTSGDVSISPAQLRAAFLGIRLSDCNNNEFRNSKTDSRSMFNNPTRISCGNLDEIVKRIRDVPLHYQQFANEMQLNHMKARQATTGLICNFVPHTSFKRLQ
ncbi:nuclear pore protein, partial [Colletotrichum incanum]